MAPFELAQPATVQEAIALLDAEDARPLSGGTALMLMMKAGVLRPQRLVSLRNLGLEKIEADGEPAHRRHDHAVGRSSAPRRSGRAGRSSRARCARSPTCACATWPRSAARWRTPIRTWTCRRCSARLAREVSHRREGTASARCRSRTSTPVIWKIRLKEGELITHVEIPPLGKRARGLPEVHHALGGRLAGGRRRRRARARKRASSFRAATDRPTRIADESALAALKIEGDLHGSADVQAATPEGLSATGDG